MDRDRFELEGVTYYRQGRKCGKAACKCAGGELHGPYWYSRDQVSGKVQYIGKELPHEITATRFAHDTLFPEMMATRRRLAEQFDAMARLIRNARLSLEDRAIIDDLGFGPALVCGQPPPATQDGDEAETVRLV